MFNWDIRNVIRLHQARAKGLPWKKNIIVISFTNINETFELNRRKKKKKRGQYYDYHVKYKIVRPFKFKYLKEYSFEKGMPTYIGVYRYIGVVLEM